MPPWNHHHLYVVIACVLRSIDRSRKIVGVEPKLPAAGVAEEVGLMEAKGADPGGGAEEAFGADPEWWGDLFCGPGQGCEANKERHRVHCIVMIDLHVVIVEPISLLLSQHIVKIAKGHVCGLQESLMRGLAPFGTMKHGIPQSLPIAKRRHLFNLMLHSGCWLLLFIPLAILFFLLFSLSSI